jgi:hypothetical protein
VQAQSSRAAGHDGDLALEGKERREIVELCLGHYDYILVGILIKLVWQEELVRNEERREKESGEDGK